MKNILTIIKIVLSLSLIIFAIKDLDISAATDILYTLKGLYILGACVSIVLVQSILAGLRVKFILHLFNYSISALNGIKFLFLGNFFSQTFVSFIGGDFARVLALKNSGASIDAASKSIFLDRALGFIGLQLIVIASAPFLLNTVHDKSLYFSILSLAYINSILILVFFMLGLITKTNIKNKVIQKVLDFGSISRYLIYSPFFLFCIVVFSCFLHFCNVLAIYFCANSLGVELSLFHATIIGSPVMLLSILPISVGGWGVREAAMVSGLGLVGVAADVSLAISIIIGLSAVIGALPGGLVLFSKFNQIRTNLAGTDILY